MLSSLQLTKVLTTAKPQLRDCPTVPHYYLLNALVTTHSFHCAFLAKTNIFFAKRISPVYLLRPSCQHTKKDTTSWNGMCPSGHTYWNNKSDNPDAHLKEEKLARRLKWR